MNNTKTDIQSLSPQQRMALREKLLAHRLKKTQVSRIPQRQAQENPPLSLAQKRVFVMHHMFPEIPLYNLYSCIEIKGDIDKNAFVKSINAIIQRHEILRTTFHKTDDGEGVQHIHPHMPLTIDLHDISDRAIDIDALHTHMHEYIEQPFDIEKGPLIRVCLCQLGTQHYRLLIAFHHLVTDGWSMAIFVRELLHLYRTQKNPNIQPLPPLDIQYGDYAEWQYSPAALNELEKHKKYWLKQLQDVPEKIHFPYDMPCPKKRQYTGDKISTQISGDALSALTKFAQKENLSLYMLLLSAFAYLIYRYSQQTDFCIGTPVAQRTRTQTEPLIGFFVNTLPIRCTLEPDISFKDFLHATRGTCVDAFNNQDVPFDWMVDACHIERRPNQTPLFQILFALQNMPETDIAIDNTVINTYTLPSRTSMFDLSAACRETEDGLHISFTYSTEIFHTSTVKTIQNAYCHLLTQLPAQAERPLQEIELLSQEEKATYENELHTFYTTPIQTTTITAAFEKQTVLYPASPAIKWAEGEMSYTELNERSDKLAAFLLSSLHLNKGDAIAVLLPKSPDAVVAFLAILKAGCVYVPIHHSYPQKRIEFILRDADVRALIGKGENSKEYENIICPFIAIDDIPKEVRKTLSETAPADNAYMIYTSGSTGIPKGVAITHQGVMAMINDITQILQIKPQERILQFFSYAFDGSIFEFLLTLCNGGCLISEKTDRLSDPAILTHVLEKYNVDIAIFPPSFIQAVGFTALHPLRILLTAAESAIPENGEFITPERHYWNLYGPSEASVDATAYHVTPNDAGRAHLPIGKEIPSVHIDILHPGGNTVQPAGAIGEICLTGITVAAGYHHRDELSQKVFVPHPYYSSQIMYRTGDLGKRMPDGNIHFCGRIDSQIAHAGYRIELNEIQIALASLPEILTCSVVYDKDNSRIVAGIVTEPEYDISVIPQNLHPLLPEYMIPHYYSVFSSLPVTTNGKTDARVIRENATPVAKNTTDRMTPETEMEELLLRVWRFILNTTEISLEASFFHSGGDSIKAIQMLSAVQKEGYTFALADVYAHPSIETLAQQLQPYKTPENKSRIQIDENIPLTPVQSWFFEHVDVDRHHFLQILSLRATIHINDDLFKKIAHKIGARYDCFKLRFNSAGKTQFYSAAPPIDTYVHDLRETNNARVEQNEIIRAAQFDIESIHAALVKAFLFKHKDYNAVVFLFHHLVIDAVSFRFIIEDFATLYDAYAHEKNLLLPPPSATYAEWAHAMTVYAASPHLKKQITYWREKEKAIRPYLTCIDTSVPNAKAYTHVIRTSCDKETSRLLLSQPPEHMKSLMMSALAETLYNWTGEDDAVISSVGHGREMDIIGVNCSRTAGWFSVFFPVHICRRNTHAETYNANYQTLCSIPDKGMGYPALKYLSRELNATEAPQITFNYLGNILTHNEETPFHIEHDFDIPLFSPRQIRREEIDLTHVAIDNTIVIHGAFNARRFCGDPHKFLDDFQHACTLFTRELYKE